MVKIRKGNVSKLQAAVALIGPITTSIDHQHNAFRLCGLYGQYIVIEIVV